MNKFFSKNYFFLISIGAVPGALLRWKIDEIIIVNTIGCFLLGLVNSMPIQNRFKLIFGFGLCGSLTTFSGWSLQLFTLLNEGFYKLFFLNLILIGILGLFAVYLGHFIAKKITS
tara:strand:- start:899 stop:1243 length:345 start_codon:yes stop_codon:yes gene_type:complete